MIAPPIPANEDKRLENLYSYCILDTDPENDFDGITHLASELFDVPVCVISIVDKDRQWFKSKVGLDVSETPRSISFCAHAINNPSHTTVVPNANEDPRFMGNPLVVGEPHVVFYAGVPLISAEGFPMGTLCIIDFVERHLTDAQLDHLKILAQQVTNLFQLRRKNEELSQALEEKAILIKEIHHRVKNNLQIISSLLNLQMSAELDDTAQAALSASRDRIMAMSLIHQQLYQSETIDKVQFDIYLKHLVDSISKLYADIQTVVDSPPINLTMDMAVPLSLITSEVITNAFKHAFEPGKKGKVTIAVEETPSGMIILTIRDNGKGFSLEERWENSGTLGFEIIKSLTDQISGTVECDTGTGGTTFTFYFPKEQVH
jgi:two-component sensor histidine kinase